MLDKVLKLEKKVNMSQVLAKFPGLDDCTVRKIGLTRKSSLIFFLFVLEAKSSIVSEKLKR